MASLNKVLLIGNLTRDPELRYTPSGTAVADLSLAVNRRYTTASGEKKEDTCFVDVTLWARRAEVASQYLKKGSPVFVEGRLHLDKWENNEGQKRSKLKIVAENFQFVGSSSGSKEKEDMDSDMGPRGGEEEESSSTAGDNVPF